MCGDAAATQEGASGVRTIDLKAFVCAAVCRGQAHVMKHCPGVEQFRIELQAAAVTGKRSPVIYPARMMKQQIRLGIPDELSYLTGELGIRNGYAV